MINLVSSKCTNYFPKEIEYFNYEINDNASSQILYQTLEILEVITEYVLKGEHVLVHCYKGISRAPTIAIAYLIRQKSMNFDDAFDFVRTKVPKTEPNAGFLIQLTNLQGNLRN